MVAIFTLATRSMDQIKWYQMGLVATKSLFGVSEKARLKPVSSATETSYKIEILPVAS